MIATFPLGFRNVAAAPSQTCGNCRSRAGVANSTSPFQCFRKACPRAVLRCIPSMAADLLRQAVHMEISVSGVAGGAILVISALGATVWRCRYCLGSAVTDLDPDPYGLQSCGTALKSCSVALVECVRSRIE